MTPMAESLRAASMTCSTVMPNLESSGSPMMPFEAVKLPPGFTRRQTMAGSFPSSARDRQSTMSSESRLIMAPRSRARR